LVLRLNRYYTWIKHLGAQNATKSNERNDVEAVPLRTKGEDNDDETVVWQYPEGRAEKN
jgi:hypothetical protein